MILVRRLLLLACVFLAAGPAHAVSMKDVELLNATLVARLHFDPEPRKGQMVGAYQVSFRTEGETPIPQVQVLLNPGFEITKVVGAGGKNLAFSSDYRTIAGQDPLELMAATITLAKPLKKGGRRQEIVIHYKGFLQDLSVSGLSGVKETLHPDFTMIRAQSFGYPVFAEPTMEAAQAAWRHKPFYQVAFLDIPGHNKVVGNLDVGSKTTSGALTRYEMKSEYPTHMMTLAIGPYHFEPNGHILTATLSGTTKIPQFAYRAQELSIRIQDLMGPPPQNRVLKILELPGHWLGTDERGLMFSNDKGRRAQQAPPRVRKITCDDGSSATLLQLLDLWGLARHSNGKQASKWDTGLNFALYYTLVAEVQRNDFSSGEMIFTVSQKRFLETTSWAQTKLAEPEKDGGDEAAAEGSALAFIVLHELLGRDAFFALVRDLRAEFSIGYADLAAVGEYLEENLTDKKARKFVQNWFFKGRIGKDLKKAKSFDELVALYR